MHFKITGRKHEKNTFIFIYVTSQKSGISISSRDQPTIPRRPVRVYHDAILKNPPRVQRRPRVLRVALLISRVDKISATQTLSRFSTCEFFRAKRNFLLSLSN